MEVGVVCAGVEVMAMGKILVSFPFNAPLYPLFGNVLRVYMCSVWCPMYSTVPTCGC